MGKREDGFHNLETFFLPVRVHDALEIVPSENETHITVTGIDAGNPENNLCIKAFHLLKKDYRELPEINIHLHKAIPVGAGLGGGSADAAFTLQLLNKKFDLNISEEKIFGYASLLGSDCPFFILNKPCLATARGELLEPINISFAQYKIAIVHPGISISTAEAFSKIKPPSPGKKIKEIIQQPIETWKNELNNDFEKYVFEKYPHIKKIKEDLYKAEAIYASMTGSGSAVFGIFKKDAIINYSPEHGYFYKIVDVVENGNNF